jgi:oligoribonuclease (3'-5' exoribonuclease)
MKLVLDIETTGLDASSDDILELGVIALLDDDKPRASYHAFGQRTKKMEEIAQVVQTMHNHNGLFAASLDDPLRTENCHELDERFADWLRELGCKEGQGVLIGFSIAFDRRFIDTQMPRAAKLLSHRMQDIGNFTRMCIGWGLPVPAMPAMPHRAMEDCEREYTHYLAVKEALQGLHTDSTLLRDLPIGE